MPQRRVHPIACPHCGEHLLHKHDGLLRCCRCNRLRQDLSVAMPLAALARRSPILLVGLLVLPLAFGVVTIDRMRSAGLQDSGQQEVTQE